MLTLLDVELTRHASRLRTYGLRVTVGAVLLGVFVRGYPDLGSGIEGGVGRPLLYQLVHVLLLAMYVIQPLMMADAIAGERAQRTLDLLRVSGVGTGAVLLQTVLARLLPMLTVLLLALPLGGAAYGLGGVEAGEQLALGTLLLAALVQVSALGLVGSMLTRSQSTAILATLALGALIYLGPLCLGPTAGLMLCPSVCLEILGGRDAPREQRWLQLIAPVLASALVAIALAPLAWRIARWLERQGRQLLTAVDRKLQRVDRAVGAITEGVVGDGGPVRAPVRWRHAQRGGFGRSLRLVLLCTGLAAAVVVSVPALSAVLQDDERLAGLRFQQHTELMVAWVLAIVVVSSAAASAMSLERARGTLESLLVTPIKGDLILREAMGGVRRAAQVAWLPLACLLLVRALLLRTATGPPGGFVAPLYAGFALVAVSRVLALARWVGLAFGLVLRRGLAITATLATLAIWAALPLWLGLSVPSDSMLIALSPAASVLLLETSPVWALRGAGLLAIPLHLLLVGVTVEMVRRGVLRHADYLLGRAVPQPLLARALSELCQELREDIAWHTGQSAPSGERTTRRASPGREATPSPR